MIYNSLNQDKLKILDFLRSNVLATISTVNSKTLQPESALVAFSELENLEILFLTSNNSRKYVNLLVNNQVAMVIGWESNPKNWATLQYEGCAHEIADKDEQQYRRMFLKKKDTPCTEEFFKKSGMKLFKTTPTWIGFSRFSRGKKPQVIEMRIFQPQNDSIVP